MGSFHQLEPLSRQTVNHFSTNMSDSDSDEFDPAVVIDVGSSVSKAGFAGDANPSYVFPSVVGYITDARRSDEGKHYVGDEALAKKGTVLAYPIQREMCTNKCPAACTIPHKTRFSKNEMEEIWRHIFQYLEAQTDQQPVMLTEAPRNAKTNRENMTQIMFEQFNVPAMYVSIQAVLSLYSSGRTTGIVLHSGDIASPTVPIYEGYALPHAIGSLSLAGRDVTAHLTTMLQQERKIFHKERIVGGIKEQLAYVAVDYEAELANAGTSSLLDREYELPDGQKINVGTERFRCAEILFKPALLGNEGVSVDQLAYNSIMACDVDIRREMYANAVLGGGTTLLPGFDMRLTEKLSATAPTSYKVKVVAPLDREYSAWIGGSIMSKVASEENPEMWMTKEEYDEIGPELVHRKCF